MRFENRHLRMAGLSVTTVSTGFLYYFLCITGVPFAIAHFTTCLKAVAHWRGL